MNSRWKLRIACFDAITKRHTIPKLEGPEKPFRSTAVMPSLTDHVVEAEALEKWVLAADKSVNPLPPKSFR